MFIREPVTDSFEPTGLSPEADAAFQIANTVLDVIDYVINEASNAFNGRN